MPAIGMSHRSASAIRVCSASYAGYETRWCWCAGPRLRRGPALPATRGALAWSDAESRTLAGVVMRRNAG